MMMIVETGSSIGSEKMPNAPPAAPEATAKVLCSSCELSCGLLRILSSATLRAASRLFVVAVAIACEAPAGRARPNSSTGIPTILVRRAAKLGCSSNLTALRSASVSSLLIGMGRFSHGTPREHTAQPLPKLTGLLGTVRGLFRQGEAGRNLEARLKYAILGGKDGGRDRDRTCDPYHVKVVLFR